MKLSLFRLQIKIIGARLFLIWYQILNKNKTCIEELIFHTQYSSAELMNAEAQKVFNTNSNDDGYYLNKSNNKF